MSPVQVTLLHFLPLVAAVVVVGDVVGVVVVFAVVGDVVGIIGGMTLVRLAMVELRQISESQQLTEQLI